MKSISYVLRWLAISIFVIALIQGFGDKNDSESIKELEKKELIRKIDELSKSVDVVSYTGHNELYDGDEDDDINIIYPDNTSGANSFVVSEFTKYDTSPTESTIRKIKEIHIPQLEKVRDEINLPIVIRSASRSYQHERKMGRSGKSQHVYSWGQGAVDISLIDYNNNNLDILEKVIMSNTNYNRVSRYKTFLHLDYAENRFGGRAYYRNTKHGWIYVGKIL